MKFIGGLIFRACSNIIAILAAAYFVPNFTFAGNFIELVITAVVLTVINTFIKPLIKLFLGPLIVITFGIFIIVINALTLFLLDMWSEPLTIQGYPALFWGTLIIGLANTLMSFGARSLFRK
ncbi:phage holin family protein [Candidatus Peregrinibacteria bacterium]|nr:phage holin family protein [Candidatus Peregrinibacteria bacterium]MBI5732473.1 phage holin family protein [Candidatus Jorgensenbacteria bacterium]